MPPAVVISPQTRPRSSGAPRPESLPSSDSASAKPIEMPAPIEAASPTRKAFHELWVAKRRGEHRRERRHRAVHQADQAGLDDLQDKPPALVLRFARPGVVGQHLVLEAGGELVVLVLGLGEVARAACGSTRRSSGSQPDDRSAPRRAPCHECARAPFRGRAASAAKPVSAEYSRGCPGGARAEYARRISTRRDR